MRLLETCSSDTSRRVTAVVYGRRTCMAENASSSRLNVSRIFVPCPPPGSSSLPSRSRCARQGGRGPGQSPSSPTSRNDSASTARPLSVLAVLFRRGPTLFPEKRADRAGEGKYGPVPMIHAELHLHLRAFWPGAPTSGHLDLFRPFALHGGADSDREGRDPSGRQDDDLGDQENEAWCEDLAGALSAAAIESRGLEEVQPKTARVLHRASW